jgi:hypothetical protein
MATKGTTEDGLPKRDREAGQKAISEELARERLRELEHNHDGFSVGGRDNASPDGWTGRDR